MKNRKQRGRMRRHQKRTLKLLEDLVDACEFQELPVYPMYRNPVNDHVTVLYEGEPTLVQDARDHLNALVWWRVHGKLR